jgi:hypothetical protein
VSRHVRRRFWLELALAIVAAALSVLGAVWPEWIEAVSGVSPDGGSGALERLVAVVPLAVAILLSALARAEWRRVGAGLAASR